MSDAMSKKDSIFAGTLEATMLLSRGKYKNLTVADVITIDPVYLENLRRSGQVKLTSQVADLLSEALREKRDRQEEQRHWTLGYEIVKRVPLYGEEED